MENKPAGFHAFLHRWLRCIRNGANRVSKLFDRVIYNNQLALIVTGIMAAAICISINYQDLSFQFFDSGSTTLNLAAVPVVAQVDEDTYEVTGVPSAADVSITGDAADIQLVRAQNSATVTADLRNLTEGTTTVALEASGLPSGIESTVTPATIDVTLARKYTKTFFITPEILAGPGQSEAAYAKPELSVRSVSIKATRDKLNSIRTVRAIIDTSGREGEFTVDAPLVAYDSTGKQVQVDISPASVSAVVKPAESAVQDSSSDAS